VEEPRESDAKKKIKNWVGSITLTKEKPLPKHTSPKKNGGCKKARMKKRAQGESTRRKVRMDL